MRRTALLLLGLVACSVPLRRARLSDAEAPSERELEAEYRVARPACPLAMRFLFPGAGQLCLRDRDTGGALLALGAAELGAGIVAYDRIGDGADPRVALPLLLFQDLYIYGIVEPTLETHRAARKRFVPLDSLPELVGAPFNWQVLKRPHVWGGLLVTAAAVGIALAVEDVDLGGERNVLGADLDPALAWPAAGGAFAVTFTHVAIAEETLFRGWAQSSVARGCGESCGWAVGSLVFGLAHVPNALALESSEERRDYLLKAIPIITAVGAYLGQSYRWSDYSLAPPVALHFWYDVLIGLTDFALNPDDSILGASIALPW